MWSRSFLMSRCLFIRGCWSREGGPIIVVRKQDEANDLPWVVSPWEVFRSSDLLCRVLSDILSLIFGLTIKVADFRIVHIFNVSCRVPN